MDMDNGMEMDTSKERIHKEMGNNGDENKDENENGNENGDENEDGNEDGNEDENENENENENEDEDKQEYGDGTQKNIRRWDKAHSGCFSK